MAAKAPLRKSVLGPLAPWLLRAALDGLAPLLLTEFEAWRRVGCLPSSDSHCDITNIPQTGAAPGDLAGLQGIAVGTQPVKLYAALLERRVSDWAEGTGQRASGQFRFRHQRSTS